MWAGKLSQEEALEQMKLFFKSQGIHSPFTEKERNAMNVLSENALAFALSKVEKEILIHAQEYVTFACNIEGVFVDSLEIKQPWFTDGFNVKLFLRKQSNEK